MTDITLIFPDQLFENHPGVAKGRTVCLAEEFLFFKVQPFHKQRLVLLRAAMRAYAEKLKNEKREVLYIPAHDLNQRGELFSLLEKRGVKKIHVAEFADEWLSQDLQEAADKWGWEISFYPSPGFICSNQEIKTFFAGKQHYSMAQFYAYQRKRCDILMSGPGPVGGKYSFDADNRKKIPKGLPIPPPFLASKSREVEQVITGVEQEFPHAIGESSPFNYPVTHEEARASLGDFLRSKFLLYGDYQDALQLGDSFLFHSVLSPLLNIGLLTPMEVVESALEEAKKRSIPLNSLEGFIRQIIGWREFVRASYFLKGSYQRSLNFFHHREKIPKCFWNGSVGIFPLDVIIKRALKTGYCNHIERLMVLGNFLLLTESAPDEVYSWFMGNFVDAYDWVMVSNVYGMSQYADGGKIVTKPYISGSNYLLKMSNYPKGEWTEIWDGLFWRFLSIHRALFASNQRTQNMVYLLDKNEQSIHPKIQKAEGWLQDYRRR
ncbi:cryptochrome/photolyase family protein [Estrella lausannensis]|nr:cryptochrome/photolyase family protein [Estrella lausannensis]